MRPVPNSQAPNLVVASDTVGRTTVLTVEGVLDATTYLPLRDCIIKAALEDPWAVIVDMGELFVPRESALAVFTSAIGTSSAGPRCRSCWYVVTMSAGNPLRVTASPATCPYIRVSNRPAAHRIWPETGPCVDACASSYLPTSPASDVPAGS
jgi:hypothetical protein